MVSVLVLEYRALVPSSIYLSSKHDDFFFQTFGGIVMATWFIMSRGKLGGGAYIPLKSEKIKKMLEQKIFNWLCFFEM